MDAQKTRLSCGITLLRSSSQLLQLCIFSRHDTPFPTRSYLRHLCTHLRLACVIQAYPHAPGSMEESPPLLNGAHGFCIRAACSFTLMICTTCIHLLHLPPPLDTALLLIRTKCCAGRQSFNSMPIHTGVRATSILSSSLILCRLLPDKNNAIAYHSRG